MRATLVVGLALLTGTVAGALADQPKAEYEALAIVPFGPRPPSASVGELIGSSSRVVGARTGAPLLPTGARGVSVVVKRTASNLGLGPEKVARAVSIEDSRRDDPTFIETAPGANQVRVHARAPSPRVARRIARQFAREYVTYRREVLTAEGTSAIRANRTAADLGVSLGGDETTDPQRRADEISVAMVLDANRLGEPTLSQETARDAGTAPRANVLGGLALGALIGLLLSARTPPPRYSAT